MNYSINVQMSKLENTPEYQHAKGWTGFKEKEKNEDLTYLAKQLIKEKLFFIRKYSKHNLMKESDALFSKMKKRIMKRKTLTKNEIRELTKKVENQFIEARKALEKRYVLDEFFPNTYSNIFHYQL